MMFAMTLCAEPLKIALIPVTVNAEQDLSVTQQGVVELLQARLSNVKDVEILNVAETKKVADELSKYHGQSKALMVGARLGADYVVYGSLTQSKENISMLLKMIDVLGKRPPLSFSKHVKGTESVIPEVNLFATQIQEDIQFSSEEKQKKPLQQSDETSDSLFSIDSVVVQEEIADPTDSLASDDSSVSVEANLPADSTKAEIDTMEVSLVDSTQEVTDTTALVVQQDSLREMSTDDSTMAAVDDSVVTIDTSETTNNTSSQLTDTSAVVDSKEEPTHKDSTVFAKEFWKSRTYPVLFNGLVLGDVDKDGRIETVVVTDRVIQIYRCVNNKVAKVLDAKSLKNRYSIGIDLADINGNSYPEIFVTCLDVYQNRVVSMVIEFNGQEYVTLEKNLPWYLRVVTLADGSPVLFGQKHGKNAPYKGRIYQMKWEKGELVADKQIIPSRSVNVLGLSYGVVEEQGCEMVVSFDKMDNIVIIDGRSGRKVWDNNEKFGGSTLYYKLDGSASIDRKYLPMRLILKDMDDDDVSEAIVVKNHDVTKNLLGKFRHYNKFHLELMVYDGLGFNTIEQTKQTSGYMRDYAIGDFNNDGKEELVGALVLKEGRSMFNKPQSKFIAYPLNRLKKK